MTTVGGVTGALRGILPGRDALQTPEEGGPWSVAGRAPGAVAFPGSVDQLTALLARACEEGLSVLPAGAGGWLGGGGLSEGVDLVISTRRMDVIEEYVPENLTLTAGAGLLLEGLDGRARKNGQWLPLDPPGWPAATLGAAVATGLPGPLVASYGRPRDHLLGLTLVTGDGRVVEPGGRVVKNVAGYDLVRAAAGSWGALGVVARVTVRLFPVPETERTLVWEASDARALVAPARGAATASVVPGALEVLDPDPEAGEGSGVALVARLLGSVDAVGQQEDVLREAVGGGPDRILEEEVSLRWHRRRAAEEAGAGHRDVAGEVLELRVALLPSELPRLLALTDRILEAAPRGTGRRRRIHGTTGVARLRLEAGDGNALSGGPWPDLLRELRGRAEKEGGTVTVVRGPAPLLREVPPRGDPGRAGRLMAGLLEAFDPAGILASGFKGG